MTPDSVIMGHYTSETVHYEGKNSAECIERVFVRV